MNNFKGIFGGLTNNKIIFNDINTIFIFGQNNSGKSSFLQAYEYFYYDTNPSIEDFYKQNMDNLMEFELEVTLEELDFHRIEEKAPKQKDSYKEYLIDGNILRIRSLYKKDNKGKLCKKKETFNPNSSSWDGIGYASIGLHTVFQSCMPRPIFIKAMPNEDEVKDILNKILKSIAESKLEKKELEELAAAKAKIAELQDKMYKPETITAYESSINSYFNKLFPDTEIKITDKKSRMIWTENKLGKEFDIQFQRLKDDGVLDASIPVSIGTIGHGTIRTAIFTLLLMRDIAEEFVRSPGRKDYLVLFEEPELFLYPKIIRELRNLIYQVSEDSLPYQILCASHSPQMIDLSKPKSSIIRLVKNAEATILYQINDKFLKEAKEIRTDKELKEAMYEVLRFNPFICESFYADEVILIEGPTEEIIIRAYFQEKPSVKDLFILNCGTVNNIPFYQKIFSKFSIPYNVICDTDDVEITSHDDKMNPNFNTNIQGSISSQFNSDKNKVNPNKGLFRVHHTTFEPAHQDSGIPGELRFVEKTNLGKPYDANLYWKEVLLPNLDSETIRSVPIINYLREIEEN